MIFKQKLFQSEDVGVHFTSLLAATFPKFEACSLAAPWVTKLYSTSLKSPNLSQMVKDININPKIVETLYIHSWLVLWLSRVASKRRRSTEATARLGKSKRKVSPIWSECWLQEVSKQLNFCRVKRRQCYWDSLSAWLLLAYLLSVAKLSWVTETAGFLKISWITSGSQDFSNILKQSGLTL